MKGDKVVEISEKGRYQFLLLDLRCNGNIYLTESGILQVPVVRCDALRIYLKSMYHLR